MSRSKKKTPKRWLCKGGMKLWKKESNRRIRRWLKDPENPGVGKHWKLQNDIWESPSDGKCWNTWWDDVKPWKARGK